MFLLLQKPIDLWEKSKNYENCMTKNLQESYNVKLKVVKNNNNKDNDIFYVFLEKNQPNSAFLFSNSLVIDNHS